jgi:hypothetical protein
MTTIESTTVQRLQPVAFDLYRDIHKGIRSELFSVVIEAGRLDPADDCGINALADQIRQTVDLLVGHAHHEDGAIQPVLELSAPALFERIATDHEVLDGRLEWISELAGDVRGSASRRATLHELYLELASFTSAYLLHQDVEEREVAQALESAVGLEGLLGIHGSIIGNMPPQELISGLAVMFPTMNVEDRTELLGGMKATAPADAFAGVWSLAKSVLPTDDHRAVAVRLGIA